MSTRLADAPLGWAFELSQVRCGQSIQFIGAVTYFGDVRLRLSATGRGDEASVLEARLKRHALEWIAGHPVGRASAPSG